MAKIHSNSNGLENLRSPKYNFSRCHEDVEDFVLTKHENMFLLKEDDNVQLSENLSFDVIEIPGHEPSCVCYMNEECIFTGDAHIPGVKVVTSFPRSNKEQTQASEFGIKDLAKNRTIYAGHKI